MESSIKIVANEALVDTCTSYVKAPLTVVHVNVGLREIFVELLAGERSVGIGGAAGIVVKLQASDQPLIWPLLLAWTRQ